MEIEIIENKEFEPIASLVEEVQNLHANLFPTIYKPFNYAEINLAMEKILSNPNCRVLVAKVNKEPIGYLLMLIKDVEENGFHYSLKILHIDQIAVAQKYQKTGVGTMLMEKAEAIAKELNLNWIELEHLEINLVAGNYFKSKGFLPFRNKLMKQIP